MSDRVEPLVWEVSIGAREPKKRIIAAFAAIIAGVIGTIVAQSPVVGVLGVLIVVMATAELFTPLKYKLDESGASVRCGVSVTSIEWPTVQRLWVDEEGVKLSPFADRHRMNAFRGVYLRFDSNDSQVLATIRELWGKDGEIVERRPVRDEGGGDDSETRESDHSSGHANANNSLSGDA